MLAGIFHSGVEVYDVEYAYGGEHLHTLGGLLLHTSGACWICAVCVMMAAKSAVSVSTTWN